MAEIFLTPLSPSATVGGVSAGSVASNAGQSAVPSAIAALPPGTLLSGFVLNRDPSGQPVLRTPQGDFLLQSELFLKIGADVVVHVDAWGKNFRAHIVSVNGQPPEALLTQPNHADEVSDVIIRSPAAQTTAKENEPKISGNPANAAGVGQTPPAGSVKPSYTATLLTPSPAMADTNDGILNLPAGSALHVTVTKSTPPQTQNPPSTAISAAPPASVTSAPMPLSAPPVPTAQEMDTPALSQAPFVTNPPTPPAVFEPLPLAGSTEGTVFTPIFTVSDTDEKATITKEKSLIPALVSQPAANPPFPVNTAATPPALFSSYPASVLTSVVNTLLQGNTSSLPGVVVNAQSPVDTMVETPLGLLRFTGAALLQTGTQLTLDATLKLFPTAAASSALTEVAEQIVAPQPGSWGALTQIMEALAHLNPLGTQDFIEQKLPMLAQSPLAGTSNPATFGSAVLFFFSAVKGTGSFRDWLGERNAERLEVHGFGSLIAQADQDFASLKTAFQQSLTQTWQTFFFPVMDESGVQLARLYAKRNKKGKGDSGSDASSNAPEQSRFIVEITLSQLGDMQLDGFMRWPEESLPQFDLVIRSHSGLSEEAQRDIVEIYHNSAELTGFTGKLQFQTAQEFPVHPWEENAVNHPPTVIV